MASPTHYSESSMPELYRSVAADAHPSVVLLEQEGRLDYFCTGSVVWCDASGTYILTQSAIFNSFPGVTIKTHFYDGCEKVAELMTKQGDLCIVRTEVHPTCRPVEFETTPTDLGYSLVLAPSTRCSSYPIPCLLFQSSLACTHPLNGKAMRGSAQQFTITCQYGEKSPNEVGRLVGGAVFGMSRNAVGIVIGDNNNPTNFAESGEDSDWEDDGFHFKICMSAMASRTKIYTLLSDCGVRKGNSFKQRQAKKQKKRRMRATEQRKWKRMRSMSH